MTSQSRARAAKGSPLAQWLAVALVAMLLATGLPAKPAAAQDPAPEPRSGVTAESLEELVVTLEDEQARRNLIDQLKALLEAQRRTEAEAKPKSVGTRFLALISDRVAEISGRIALVLPALVEVPKAGTWARARLREPATRAALAETVGKLFLVLGLAWIASRIVSRLLRRTTHSLEARAANGVVRRVFLRLARSLLDLVPLAGFAATAYLVLPLTEARTTTRLLALAFINAHIMARAIAALARFVFSPRLAALRLFEVGDLTAHYVYIWVSRLSAVAVYGYFILLAALLIGLPREIHGVLVNVVGFILAMLLIVLILQNRKATRDWLRGAAEARSPLAALRRATAELWHFVAIAYIFGAYGVWILEIPGGFAFLAWATALTAAIVAAAWLFALGLRKLFERGFRVRDDLKQRFPELEARANLYMPGLQQALRFGIAAFAALLVLEVWGFGTLDWLTSDRGRDIAGRGLSLVLVLGLALLVWEVASAMISRYLERKAENGQAGTRARLLTLLPLLRNVLRVVLVVMAVLIVLSELGLNIAPLLAGAGVVGLAVGFGAQTLVKDLITGVLILMEDNLAVGDWVEISGHGGTVETMTIRTVNLRDIYGTVHTIPWGEVASLQNMSKDYGYAVIEVGVAYREDIDEVIEVLKEIGAELQQDEVYGPEILGPLEVSGLNAFSASSVDIRVSFKTMPLKQWRVRREFNRRLKRVFDEKGIEIPFPHQTLYFGVDKEGRAPAARVALDRGGKQETARKVRKQASAASGSDTE